MRLNSLVFENLIVGLLEGVQLIREDLAEVFSGHQVAALNTLWNLFFLAYLVEKDVIRLADLK